MQPAERIDSHQHFWRLDRGDYSWLTPELMPLYRDFMPEHLTPLLSEGNITHTVLVQAAPTTAETEFLLQLAERSAFVAGVVGWIELERAQAPAQIAQLSKHPKLVGIRPMLQDIADPKWMLRDDLAPALQALAEHELVFDALVKPIHLEPLVAFCRRHRGLRIVVDHAAKPTFRSEDFASWAKAMRQLASEPHVTCKLSGLVTEAHSADPEVLSPYVDHLLQTFGPKRMMWGSDWPVCTLVCGYEEWLATSEQLLRSLSPDEHTAIFSQVARETYRL